MYMYMDLAVWLGIIVGGVAGCIATAFVANRLKDVPFSAVAGNPRKHLWSILFAIPVPLILASVESWGVFAAFVWLVAAPTIASKLIFGPKHLPAIVLAAFHSGYGVAVLAVYVFVTRSIAIAIS